MAQEDFTRRMGMSLLRQCAWMWEHCIVNANHGKFTLSIVANAIAKMSADAKQIGFTQIIPVKCDKWELFGTKFYPIDGMERFDSESMEVVLRFGTSTFNYLLLDVFRVAYDYCRTCAPSLCKAAFCSNADGERWAVLPEEKAKPDGRAVGHKKTNKNSKPQKQNSSTPKTNETMEAKNMKAADLIGKVIIVGDNIATITIKSANGDTLQGEFRKEGVNPMPLPITLSKLQEQVAAGAWHLSSEAGGAEEPAGEPTGTVAEKEAATEDTAADNPMMKQFRDLKAKHPDALLLFRCGDFYETYEDDAKECAKILGITLTYRAGDKMPMAGFPHHALDVYLPKLVRAGKHVAICDQLEMPKATAKRGEPTDTVAEEPKRPRVQPRAAKVEEPEANDNDNDNANDNEPEANPEPRTLNPEPEKPRASKSEVTLEAEKGAPRIIDNGKSIIVAGDTARIEAVLMTMWGRKRPYTHNGRSYSGIVLSAKHKATVAAVIELAKAS